MGETVRRFEDLIAWQKARLLTREIYALTQAAQFARDRGLADQMRRAAVSVMANIAEGFERPSSADFARYLVIAKGSCGELRSHMYVAVDAGYVVSADGVRLTALTEETSRIIAGLLKSTIQWKVAS